ncbi:hypothetical protein [Streptomyces sp. DH10]|uniref:hypothetical protein n=1 Tax=Streptomyces sp. DH10 TaxID=3040121 RepID=UPI0024419615|nr:hypothetical protein [Streptomyces sp. DH10]MDG9709595.1 hypothetical protein [Streptomyces sp. DH10]
MLLLVGEEEAQVDAWLAVFTGDGRAEWGGVLHAVPVRLAAAVQHGDDVRIRLLPDGPERRIHAANAPGTEDQEYVDVLFIGEGKAPRGPT